MANTKPLASQVIYKGSSLRTYLDSLGEDIDYLKSSSLKIKDYSELREYSGTYTLAYLYDENVSGYFVVSQDVVPDDGAFYISDAVGRTWERLDKSPAISTWFESGIQSPSLSGITIDVVTNTSVSTTPVAYLFSSTNSFITIGSNVIQLGSTPFIINSHLQTEVDGTLVRYTNVCVGTDSGRNLLNNSSSYANTSVGDMSLQTGTSGIYRVTAVGTASCRDLKRGYSIVGVGCNTFKWSEWADRSVSVGDNSSINMGQSQARASQVNGIYNGATELAARFDSRYPAWRVKYWDGALPSPSVCMTAGDFENKATHCVAVGRNALGFSITPVNSVAVGYDALTCAIDANNATAVGDRCMQYSVDVLNSAGFGNSVLANTYKVNQTLAIGNLAGSNYTVSEQNTMIGYQALRGSASLPNGATATGNVAIGRIAGANGGASLTNSVMIGHAAMAGEGVSGDGHTAIGHRSLGSLGTGYNGNTSLGKDSLRYLTTGNFNTAFGTDALSLMQDGSNATNLTYATGLGWGSRVSGNNQLQLGSSAVTTYAYGAIQDRSDERDKTDLRDLDEVWDEFLMRHEVKQGRWDMRDDYIIANEDGTVDYLDKDGSKARIRFHNWFIAQQVLKICQDLGIDFAGLQHHARDGGCDVYTIGYAEYIPLLLWFGQRNRKRIVSLEEKLEKALERISILESK